MGDEPQQITLWKWALEISLKKLILLKEIEKLWKRLKHWMWFMLLINSLPASPVCYLRARVCLARSRPTHVDIPEDLMQTASDRWRLREPVDWDGSQRSDGPPHVFQQLWAEELYVADAHRSLSFRGSYRMVESSDEVWMLLWVKGMTGFSHHSFCDISRWGEGFAFLSGAFELSTVLNTDL